MVIERLGNWVLLGQYSDCERPSWKSPWKREQVCKPNSVLRFQIWDFKFDIWTSQIWNRSGDHSSSPTVTDRIKRPTRKLRAGSPGNASLFGLAPRGVCLAAHVATRAGALLLISNL